MGVFNFMETFFFISLGITFILILLLVYHFKQRLGTIEQKGDTMFEIVNTMVREMSLIKSMVISQMRETPIYSPVNEPIITETPNVEFTPLPNALDKLDEHSQDDDSEDEDSDDDDDEGSDSEDDKIVVSDDDEDDKNSPLVKVINIPFSETANFLTDTIEIVENEKDHDLDADQDLDQENTTDLVYHSIVNTVDITTPKSEPIIIVNKITNESEEINVLEETKETKEYNKMSLYNLKNLVVSRGLATDSSKMKKLQLIQLLESLDKNL